MILFHNGTADAATDTSRHFNKAFMDLSAFNILECGNTIFNAVKRDISISGSILRHSLKYASRCREEACTALGSFVDFLFKLNMLGLQPIGELLES